MQSAACGRSGIILNEALVTTAEDEAAHSTKSHSTSVGHGTAVLSCLVAPWAGSWRVFCADSYFTSVEAARYLLGMGLKFIGVVNTATRIHPMGNLSRRKLAQRDGYVSLVAKDLDRKVQMMALMCWIGIRDILLQQRRHL
jgi:hypothetical protein